MLHFRDNPLLGHLSVVVALLAGCGGAPLPSNNVPAPAVKAAKPRTPLPDFSRPERIGGFVARRELFPNSFEPGVTDPGEWSFYEGVLWPKQETRVGLYSRSKQRFEHFLPHGQLVKFDDGTIVVLSSPSYLVPPGKDPILLDASLEQVSLSADKQHMLGSSNGKLSFYDVHDGSLLRAFDNADGLPAKIVHVLPETYVLGDPQRYDVVRKADLTPLLTNMPGPVSPDGRFIVDYQRNPYDYDMYLRIHDTTTGKVVYSTQAPDLMYSRMDNQVIAFTPNSERLSWIADRYVHVYETATGRVSKIPWQSLSLDQESDADSSQIAAVTEDGKYVCFATDRRDLIWDVQARNVYRPGRRQAHCRIDGGAAYVVELSLAANDDWMLCPAALLW